MEELTAEQQAHVDKLVGDARVKAREKAQADFTSAQNTANDEAAKAQLAAEAKWQELAGQHEARVRELEPFEAKAKEYDTLIKGMLRDRVKALGEAAKKAVDGLPEGMTASTKLAWLTKNEALFEAGPTGVGTPRREVLTPGVSRKNQPYEPPLRL